jgi:serine/threonine protein kinase/Flp pilus assembly protein TadD
VPALTADALSPGPADPPAVPGYEILRELGRGGMGVVYLARQAGLRRLVALKMILAGGHAGEAARARFRTEAEAVARLQDPHIVTVHEVGEHQGLPYLCLEYLEGGSLARRLDGTPLPARPAAQLVGALARAADYAHCRGVVHRDLKPANVLLAADGTPKLTDFGLAKLLDEANGPTGTGDVLGTPSYMAPEQTGQGGQPVGPAADVYALGAILYELLTGRPPFKGATALDTVFQVVHQEPVPPRRLQPKVPRDLETVCLKCLAKEPAKRYASAGALADDLGRFLQDRPTQARPAGKVESLWRWCRRSPKVAGLLTALAFVLVAGTATVTSLWLLAEERRRAAESSLALADRRHQEARANYRKARDAVDRLAVVGDQALRHVPHQERLQRALLEEALRLNQQFLQEKSDDPEVRQETARTYSRLGYIRQLLGEDAEAEKLYRQALALSAGLADEFPDRLEYRVDQAHHYGYLAHLLTHRRPHEAEEACGRGLALLNEVVARSPGVPEYRARLANLQDQLGSVLSQLNRSRAAEASYRQALEIRQGLAVADPDAPEYQSDLGSTFHNLAHLLMNRGERSRAALGASTVALAGSPGAGGPLLAASALAPERIEGLPQARQLISGAIAHQRKALEKEPGNTNYRTFLARQYDLQGAIVKRLDDLGEAERAIRESAAVRQRLADEFPAIPRYQSELGGALNNLAIIQKRQGKLAEARRSVEQAITRQQAARKMSPENPVYRQYLYNHYWNLADFLVLLGEHAAARTAAAELSAVFPERGQEQITAAWFVARCLPLAEKDAALPAEKRRELVQRYGDQAMRYLREGVAKKGLDSTGFYTMKEGFDFLRSRADYQELLPALEAPMNRAR